MRNEGSGRFLSPKAITPGTHNNSSPDRVRVVSDRLLVTVPGVLRCAAIVFLPKQCFLVLRDDSLALLSRSPPYFPGYPLPPAYREMREMQTVIRDEDKK